MIYRLILTLRNARYSNGARSTKAAMPTICVGNITAGGTGKTPHTEMILRELAGSERWGKADIAVLSRGYKRRSKGYQLLPADATAQLYGDEPAQIKHKFPAVQVAVDKDRLEGCRQLGSDITVLDDAYQYRKLKADLNIVLSDWNRPVTKDSLLPFGRLRDLPKRLYDSDIVIVTKCPADLTDAEKQDAAHTLGYESLNHETCTAARKGKEQFLLFTRLDYGKPEPVFANGDIRYTYAHNLILISGIAEPGPMLGYLSDSYSIVEHLKYPDHHRFGAADIRKMKVTMKRNPTAVFMTTEKDAQRLRDLKKIPAELQERLFFLPVSAKFLSTNERNIFIDKLTTI